MLKYLSLFLLVIMFTSAVGVSSPAAAQGCDKGISGRRTRYDFDVTFNWSRRLVQVEQTVKYRNDFDEPLTELVFHSEPHRLSRVNTMTFYNAYEGEDTVLPGVTFDKMRMTVPLITPVEPGCDAQVRLVYDINMSELDEERNPLGWLAYTPSQINIAHWFPVIALYNYETPGQWYTTERHFIGEQAVTEPADMHAVIKVENAPENVVFVAPGAVEEIEPHVWDITFNGGRDLGMSFSTIYVKSEQQVGDVTVEMYALATTYRGSVERALEDAAQALALFEDIYGEYPWDRLVIAEGAFPDGLELSGMVFVSTDWFVGWNGNNVHWLTVITVHEVAHQWFYALIANDQSLYPYLDEALATYSELLYYEHYYPTMTEDWWQFRIRPYGVGTDPVDSTVHDYTNWRPYINTVYFRGVEMLHEIRQVLGDELFRRWLSDYVEANRDRVATPQTFWGAMSGFSYASTADLRLQYLSSSDPLAQ